MRLLHLFFFITFFSFSQTNEVLINQALQTAESQDIQTKSQAVKALQASGMSESQARQLARQRGLSYDQLLNDYFSDETSLIENIKGDPDTSILENKPEEEVEEIVTEEEEMEESEEEIEYFGYNIFDNNPYLNKEYLLGNIDEVLITWR